MGRSVNATSHHPTVLLRINPPSIRALTDRAILSPLQLSSPRAPPSCRPLRSRRILLRSSPNSRSPSGSSSSSRSQSQSNAPTTRRILSCLPNRVAKPALILLHSVVRQDCDGQDPASARVDRVCRAGKEGGRRRWRKAVEQALEAPRSNSFLRCVCPTV